MKNRQTYHNLLTPFVIHGEFMTREGVLRIARADESLWSARVNNRLKSLADTWQAVVEQTERGRNEAALRARVSFWSTALLQWLGYSQADGFQPEQMDLGNDTVATLSTSSDHSVTVWVITDLADMQLEPSATFDVLPAALDQRGSRAGGRVVTLGEWAELILRHSGKSDLIAVARNRLFWFRADAVTASSCLQVNLDDALQIDALERMALTGHLLGAHSFAEGLAESSQNTAAGADDADDLADEDDENPEDDEEEGTGPQFTSTRVTRAAEWLKDDLEQQRQITEDLHRQVTTAIELLVNAYLKHNRNKHPSQARREQEAFTVFKDGLFFIYRILFVLFAEARERLPRQHSEYNSAYSLEGLLDWCDAFDKRTRMGALDPSGTYVWQTLRAIFSLLRRGVRLPGQLQVVAFNGQLFAPDQCKTFDEAAPIPDGDLVPILLELTTRQTDSRRERLNYANLETAQLGAVYEALLAQRPKYLTEDHVWVEAGKNVGLVPLCWVKGLHRQGSLDYKVIDTGYLKDTVPPAIKSPIRRSRFDEFIDPKRPAQEPLAGRFVICPSGGAKRQTASFYTPKKLAQFLAFRTLKPLLEGCRTPEEVLRITVLEPSVGCGAFLVAALGIMAKHLLQLAATDKRPASQILGGVFGRTADPRDPEDLLRAKRLVVESCLYGVDTNPLSLELCRVILYLESLGTERPLPFLHHHLKQGNALLGADLSGRFARTFAGAKLNWAFIPSTNLFRSQTAGSDSLLSHFESYVKAARNQGQNVADMGALKETLEKAQADMSAARRRWGKGAESVAFARWAQDHQKNIDRLLAEAAALEDEFEAMDKREGGVDAQDALFRDRAWLLPESDELLIEAWGLELPEQLVRLRKEAIKRENNQKVYKRLVLGSRAAGRLRAFAHLATALQTWPLDELAHYPKWQEYQHMCDVLLATPLGQSIPKASLSKRAFAALRTALQLGKRMGFFHVDLEFPHIMKQGGFAACLGNPPWKPVQVRRRDVYPAFDPVFQALRPSQTAARLKTLDGMTCAPAAAWWWENHKSEVTCQFWQAQSSGESAEEPQVFLGAIPASGQLDLCSLFLLRSEGILRPGGAFGFIVSHSGIFVTRNTKTLRERFFSDMALREAAVFENRQKIFDIDSRITFAAIIASPGQQQKAGPQFVQGITDLGDLDLVSGLFDGLRSGPHAKLQCTTLTKTIIQAVFSPEILSIPMVHSSNEMHFLEAIFSNQSTLTRFDAIAQVTSGTHGTSGPRRGLSIYTEHLASKGYKAPKVGDLFLGQGQLVPQYKGESGGHFDPLFLGAAEDPLFEDLGGKLQAWRERIQQWGCPNQFAADSAQREMMGEIKLAWRAISSSTNQRTLVPFLCPDESWGDHSAFFSKQPSLDLTLKSLSLLSSLVLDNIIRYQVTSNVTSGVMASLPLDLTPTRALQRAADITLSLHHVIPDHAMPPKWRALMKGVQRVVDTTARQNLQAELDALIYLHYSRASAQLGPQDFQWMIEHRFKALCRNSPDYVQAVFAAVNRLWPERDHWRQVAVRKAR